MSERAKVTPYAETAQQGPAYWQVGILWVVLATGEQTGGAYSLMWELCPKGSGPGPHYHDQDEQFYVIDGEITYLADGHELKAGPGTFVLIPRGTVHSFRIDTETATLLNSYTPPPGRPAMPGDRDAVMALFEEIGMHPVDEPDVLRS